MKRLVVLLGGWLIALATSHADSRKPSIYFCDFYASYYNAPYTRELIDAGFEVGKNRPDPNFRWRLTWDTMKQFNVIVIVGVPNDFTKEHADLLDRYLAEGGGLLFFPIAGNDIKWSSSRAWFEQTLGLKVFAEQIVNPGKTFEYKAAGGRIAYPVAWTDAIAASPVTEGVKNLWYPVDRGSFWYNTAPLDLTPDWQPLVKTGPGARSLVKSEDYVHGANVELDRFSPEKGREGDFPIAAVRALGNGRAAAVGVCPQVLLWSGHVPAFESILLSKGAQGRPSDWAKLLQNLYRHLAEPSLASGKLGGYVTDPKQVFPQDPGDPTIDFREDAKFAEPIVRPLIGIAGARSSLSTGKSTVREWSEAARAAGYDFLVFAEDMKRMDAVRWETLKNECRRNSDTNFLAYPGMEFEQELGDRGFFLDHLGQWPIPKVFTADGARVRTSRGVGDVNGKMWLNFRQEAPLAPGILNWYGWQLAMGHFAHDTNPTPFWNHNLYQLFGVFTRDEGRVLDDERSIPKYLEAQGQILRVAPIALELLGDAKRLPKPFEKGAAAMIYPGSVAGLQDKLVKLGEYGYAGLSSPISVSKGPIVRQWDAIGSLGYIVPRWQTGPKESDFYYTPNYRMRLRLVVESHAGLRDIEIYDGVRLWRRFDAKGARSFDRTLEVLNDRHAHFVAVVTDRKGRRAVTPEIQTESWLNRIYWCSDRCNFGSHPHNHSAGIGNPVFTRTLGDERCVLNRWTFPFWGPDCGLVQGHVETMFCKGAFPDNGHNSYFDTEPIPDYTWANREYWWYQQHARRFLPFEDYGLQGWDQMFTWPKPPGGNAPQFGYTEKHDTFTFLRETTFDGAEQWSIRPLIEWKGLLNTNLTSDYELRLGGQRVSGPIPRDKPLELTGPLPSGSLVAMRLHGSGDPNAAQAATAIVHGEGLHYFLRTDATGRHFLFRVGWQENGKTVPAGTTRDFRRFIVCNPAVYRSEHFVLYYKIDTEFTGPEAGFSAALLDRLEKADWFRVERGTVEDKLLPLGVRADDHAASVTVPEVLFPIYSMPIAVSGLNPNWTVHYFEPKTKLHRPVAVSEEGVARVQFDRRKKDVTVWVGHPVVCDPPGIRFDVIDRGEGRTIIEANNPTDKAMEVTFRGVTGSPLPAFEPFTARIEAGGHYRKELP